jgi:hypothetical protein
MRIDRFVQVRIEVPDGGGCFVRHPSRVAYYSFVSSVLFFMPVAVMSVTYGLVIWKLWSSKRPGEILAGDTHTQDRIRKRVSTQSGCEGLEFRASRASANCEQTMKEHFSACICSIED